MVKTHAVVAVMMTLRPSEHRPNRNKTGDRANRTSKPVSRPQPFDVSRISKLKERCLKVISASERRSGKYCSESWSKCAVAGRECTATYADDPALSDPLMPISQCSNLHLLQGDCAKETVLCCKTAPFDLVAAATVLAPLHEGESGTEAQEACQ